MLELNLDIHNFFIYYNAYVDMILYDIYCKWIRYKKTLGI